MRRTIVDDRFLARIAYESAGHGQTADPLEGADIAYGQAMIALRVHGAEIGPDALRALRADIDAIFAQPAELARARHFARPPQASVRSSRSMPRLAIAS